MEVTQMVGVRTRARTLALASAAAVAAEKKRGSKRRKAAEPAEVQNSYLQLRSRTLVMTPRIARTPANSGGARARRPSPAPDRLSRCSSNASSEVVSVEDRRRRLQSGDPEGDDLETSPRYFACSKEMRETTPSSELRGESGDLESMAGKRNSRTSAMEAAAAVAAEVDDFLAAAERTAAEDLRFFGHKYNYDVANDVPLDGRYQWLRVNP